MTLLALAVAAWSLYVMTRQLTVARSASGGRAMVFTVGNTGRPEHPPRFDEPNERGVRQLAVESEYRVRLAVAGPSVLHQASVFLVDQGGDSDYQHPERPDTRITMTAADEPIDWTFSVPKEVADNMWAVVTWREPYLEGIHSLAIARWLNGNDTYWLNLYRPWSRWMRIRVRNWARKHPRWSWERLREKSVYGKWKRRTPANALDIQGTIGPPPRP